jgi:ParB family transcriptional regulator, chromosome partitioning protein
VARDIAEIRFIPIEQLRRSICTPRINHDEAQLERLAHWIVRRGVLQPILVRAIGMNAFEVVAGERRFLAAQRAGLSALECRVRTYDDLDADDAPLGDVLALEDALVENLVRENLSVLEESEAMLELVSLHLGETREFVLERLGAMHGRAVKRKSLVNVTLEDDAILEVFAALNLIGWRAFYTHRVPLLRLPDELKCLLNKRTISYGAATRLARLAEKQRSSLIEQIRAGTLRGKALNLELDRLLNPKALIQQRWQRVHRVLSKRMSETRVLTKLEALERELGLS